MREREVALALFAALSSLAGCTVPDLDERGKECTATCPSGMPCLNGVCGGAADGSSAQASDAACSPAGTADPCLTLPRFVGSQVVDGLGGDFCGVPALVWSPASGDVDSADPTPPPAPFAVQVQTAWSAEGLHAFVHVPKWPPAPAPADAGGVYFGDAVELFFAGSSADITGFGNDTGTIHLIAGPPAVDGADGGGAGVMYTSNSSGHVPPLRALTPSEFRCVLLPGVGFDIEIELGWASFGATAPSAGAGAGFDLGVDLLLPDADGGAHMFQSFFYATPQPKPNGVCDSVSPAPACDDRTWCSPLLQ